MPRIKLAPAWHGVETIELDVAQCDVIGPFAVHPFYTDRGETAHWTATHIASGGGIGRIKTKTIARRLAKELAPLTNADATDLNATFSDFRAAFDIVRPHRLD